MSTVPLSFAMRRPSLSGKKRVLSAVGSTTERVVSNALFVAPSKLIVWSSSICRFPSRLKLPLISLSWPLMTTFLPAWSTRSAYVTLEILTASEYINDRAIFGVKKVKPSAPICSSTVVDCDEFTPVYSWNCVPLLELYKPLSTLRMPLSVFDIRPLSVVVAFGRSLLNPERFIFDLAILTCASLAELRPISWLASAFVVLEVSSVRSTETVLSAATSIPKPASGACWSASKTPVAAFIVRLEPTLMPPRVPAAAIGKE